MNFMAFMLKQFGVELKEHSASQEHFFDISRVLGHQAAAQLDSAGELFTLERAGTKSIGGQV